MAAKRQASWLRTSSNHQARPGYPGERRAAVAMLFHRQGRRSNQRSAPRRDRAPGVLLFEVSRPGLSVAPGVEQFRHHTMMEVGRGGKGRGVSLESPPGRSAPAGGPSGAAKHARKFAGSPGRHVMVNSSSQLYEQVRAVDRSATAPQRSVGGRRHRSGDQQPGFARAAGS